MPGLFDDPQDLAAYFKDIVNQGERKGQTRGSVVHVPFPSRTKWNAMLAAYAPGCGSPTPVPGTGGEMPCGARLEGRQVFCSHCAANQLAEQLLEADEDPEEIIAKASTSNLANIDISKFDTFEVHPVNFDEEQTGPEDTEIAAWTVFGHVHGFGLTAIEDFRSNEDAEDAADFLQNRKDNERGTINAFYVSSSHGMFIVALNGNVISFAPNDVDDGDAEDLKRIVKFDVDEFTRFYKHRELDRRRRGSYIDILDLGDRLNDGTYEPPAQDWREEFGDQQHR